MRLSEVLDGALGRIETPIVGSLHLGNRYPPLFIVGAIRSGTTVVYQHVTNSFRFAFFPNLSRRFPRACVSAAALARVLGGPEQSYRSRFGEMEGTGAPSDGWEVFHRWFPRYDYSVPVEESRLHELRTIVRLLERIYGAPFVNKNNSNSVRIHPLKRLFPGAHFIHVERDLPETVDSILRSRADRGVSPHEWWGAPPPRFAQRGFEDEVERAVTQVWGLRQQIRDDLRAYPEGRCTTLDYDEFCGAPGEILKWVEEAYSRRGIRLRSKGHPLPTSFSPSRSDRAKDEVFRQRVDAIAAGLEAETPESIHG